MAKAILVLDEMPKRCDDCWLANFQREDCYCYCTALQKPVDYDDPNYEEMDTESGDWRWRKCPLKELPEPEINNYITDEDWEWLPDDYEVTAGYAVGHQDGWNDCLREIQRTGDEDETFDRA